MNVSPLIIALLAISSANLSADGTGYQIELIGFAQKTSTSETFTLTNNQVHWPTNELLSELSSFEPATSTLATTTKTLAQNPLYQPLLHASWQQPLEQGKFAPVHIKNKEDSLNGFIQIQNTDHLRLLVDFAYTPPPTPTDEDSITYRLSQTTDIELNKIYYLDHPKFGIIAKITRP